MNKRKCLKIISDLEKFNALWFVIWQSGCDYPRVWLKEWCGVRNSVSIGTAEMILNAIRSGELTPAFLCIRPVRRKLKSPQSQTYVETFFVR